MSNTEQARNKTQNRHGTWLLILLIHLFTYSLTHCLYSQTDSEVYFNSAIDKYVKGDYDGAIALFEQTLSENPNHQKAKNFLVKVLIEATEKQIMMSNFQKAKVYIDKAKFSAPDNPKVNDLFKVVSGGYAVKKQETHEPAKIKERVEKQSRLKPVEIKKEKQISAEKTENPVELPSARNDFRAYFIISMFLLIVVSLSGFVWLKRKSAFDSKKIEELRNKIRSEEEKKLKQELEKMKRLKNEEVKKEISENTKIQIAEHQAISEKDAEKAQKQLAETVEEGKLLNTVSDELKNDQYSKQIIKRMVVSLRTIMNINKPSAMENIVRLSKSDNSRIRFDCVNIIEDILTAETFNILLSLLNDNNQEVKRAAIRTVKNLIKSSPPEISEKSISVAKSMLKEEQIKNGWII